MKNYKKYYITRMRIISSLDESSLGFDRIPLSFLRLKSPHRTCLNLSYLAYPEPGRQPGHRRETMAFEQSLLQ